MLRKAGVICCGLRRRRAWPPALFAATILCALIAGRGRALAVTPESPEVQKLVDAGLEFLSQNGDERVGGKCLIGLAFLKAERRDHPRVQEAVYACREAMNAGTDDANFDVYSNGLAPIFLCELAPQQYAKEIEWFLNRMHKRQKEHGGWGYSTYQTGDTSQTQYGTLSYWEAHRNGFHLDQASVENVADWLIRTQDPSGCWGYQGEVAPAGGPLIEQAEMNCSMLAAGLGSAYVCADLLNVQPRPSKPDLQSAAATDSAASGLPPALRAVVAQSNQQRSLQQMRAVRTDVNKLLATIARAHGWMDKNYAIDIGSKRYYYLYALERYKSFQELFEGQPDEDPKWYNDGYQFLAQDQAADGSWSGYCGPTCDTAFSILFLLRSTQKSIRARLGEGTLLGGRGLPRNLARAKLRNGQVVVDQVRTKVDQLLSMIDDGNEAMLDELARDPAQLVVETVDENSARRLEQLVRGGEPEVRLLAVRALGRTGNLDYVPALLYALTDPDARIVLEARDGLRFTSRNFKGYGPPDEFTEAQRFEAVAAWKNWYRSLRPTAVLE